jgi:hypothetical protein
MANQPALEIPRGGLGMKLKCHHALTVAERLVPAEGRGSQQLAARGQIKRIAVPMQNRNALQMPRRAIPACLG